MQAISFRYKHDCVFARLSARFPGVPLSNWCNFTMEILEFRAKDPVVARAIESELANLAKRGFKRLDRSSRDGTNRMVLMRCGHKRGTSVDEVLEDHGCLVLYPVVYREGWEHYRVVALDEDRLPELFAALGARGAFEILSKRRTDEGLLSHSFLLSTGELFAELTPKQASALHAAIESGYYRVPRKTRTEDIAKARRVPRTTFEEHVRKAESKILNGIAPYVALYAGASA